VVVILFHLEIISEILENFLVAWFQNQLITKLLVSVNSNLSDQEFDLDDRYVVFRVMYDQTYST
jgi:hypothetical protein